MQPSALDGSQPLLSSSVAEDAAAESDGGEASTMTWRIYAIFIILAFGSLGALPPLFMKVGRPRKLHAHSLLELLTEG